MKVGIITLPFGANYGWALQRWALYHVVESLGHTPIIINRKWTTNHDSLWITAQRFFYYHILCPRFKRFVEKECPNLTVAVRTSEETTEVTKSFDAIIVGSDQVWRIENTRMAGYDFFLAFVKDDRIMKISYAASFGKDTWMGTDKETQIISSLLSRFNTVSVREASGVVLCDVLFHVPATQVLDPTLLLTAKDYNSFLSTPQPNEELVTYLLDSSRDKRDLINGLTVAFNLKVVNLFPRNKFTVYRSVYEWLERIRDAKYVVVDSFHGMVFCILFHKQFVVLANEKRGLTRFTSLLDLLGLRNRMTNEPSIKVVSSILNDIIDYGQVDQVLQKSRDYSMQFLKRSLISESN